MNRLLPVCALAVAALAGACKPSAKAARVGAGSTMADSAEQVMYGVRTLLTDRGVQRGELFADTAYVFDDSRRFELRKVRATFNKPGGEKDGVMSADRGRYDTQQLLLEGFGNVVIVTNDGRRVNTPQLRYSQGLNEVSSDTTFTLVRPGQTISGVGFKSDPQLTRFSILRGAKGSGSFTLPGQ